MARTKDFADVIRAKLTSNPDLAAKVEAEAFYADIATKVYELRTEAGLTQKQLAERVGTQQSVISRIEDADYDGHSLGLLKRIADALGKKLRIEFYACATSIGNEVAETYLRARDAGYILKMYGSSNSLTSMSAALPVVAPTPVSSASLVDFTFASLALPFCETTKVAQ